jgi:asparagine synthase (glutamine-hydrolysing)
MSPSPEVEVPRTVPATSKAAPGRERGAEILGRFAGGRASVAVVHADGRRDVATEALRGWVSAGDPAGRSLSSMGEARGQWALVRAAAEGGRLEAVVDQMGDEPLYWAERGGTTVVASQLPLLLAELEGLGGRPGPFLPRVLEWIEWGFTDPTETLFEGVRSVPAGQALVVDASGARLRRYWQPVARLDNGATVEEWCERLREGLTGALRRQLPEDGYALLLSGGLDSSTVAGWIARDPTLPQPAVAASLRYPGLPSDESDYQDAVLRLTGFESLVVEPQPFDAETFVARVRAGASPVALAAPETDALYGLLSARGIDTAVSGVGGDELFAPIRWGLEELVLQRRWGTIGRWWRTQGWAGMRRELRRRVPYLGVPGTRGLRARRRKPEWATEAAARRYLGTRLVPRRSLPGRHATGRERAEFLESAMILNGRASDANRSRFSGVELRAPLFDVELVVLALRIPDSLRHAEGDSRWLQRTAFGSQLPREVRERRGKVHFDYRYAQHLQDPWVRDQLEGSRLVAAGLLDGAEVMAAYEELATAVETNIEAIPYLAGPLWRIVGLETWWREFAE